MKLEIRKLKPNDDRAAFCSGDVEIDRFFIKYAGQNQFKHTIGTTYVAIDKSNENIIGYVTVSVSSLHVNGLEKSIFNKFPKYPLPILRIARLGVDQSSQAMGIGKRLLQEMLFLAIDLQAMAGCVGVVVDAKEDAVSFYEKFGFKALFLEDGELHVRPRQATMYLSIACIKKSIKK